MFSSPQQMTDMWQQAIKSWQQQFSAFMPPQMLQAQPTPQALFNPFSFFQPFMGGGAVQQPFGWPKLSVVTVDFGNMANTTNWGEMQNYMQSAMTAWQTQMMQQMASFGFSGQVGR